MERSNMSYRYLVCLLIFLCYFLVYFHRLAPAVIALDMQMAFGATGPLLGLLGGAYFYAYALMQWPTGLLADSWGPRKTVSTFFVIAAFGSLMMGLAPTLPMAMLGRVMVGVGVATVFVCNFKLLAEWFEPRRFILMGGIFQAVGGLGAISAGAPLAWMSEGLGWRMALVAVGVATLVMAIAVYGWVRDRPQDIGFAAVRTEGTLQQDPPPSGLLGGLKVVLFSRRFWLIASWTFFATGLSFAIGGLWGGPYLMEIHQMSKASAGKVLSTFSAALLVAGPILGFWANRLGRKKVLISCSVVLTFSFGVLAVWVDSVSLPLLYVLFFLVSFCGAATGPVTAAVSKELFPPAMAGTSVGAVNLFPFAGAAIFQWLLGYAVSSAIGTEGSYSAAGFRWLFLVCTIGASVSFMSSILLRETLPKD
jgi:MFS family permease